MQSVSRPLPVRSSLVSIAVAAALMSAFSSSQAATAPVIARGVVAGSYFTATTTTVPASSAASYYSGAKVCFDLNNNGVCDTGEPSAVTGATGAYQLMSAQSAALVAEIPTTATNNGHPVTQRLVLRAAQQQVAESSPTPLVPANVAITPLTTEIARSMEADGLSYQVAKDQLAERLGVSSAQVVSDPAKVAAGVAQKAVATEANILANRFGLATKMFDRHDVSPAALAANPAATAPAITMKEAQQVSMNLEGIPRYDHIFVIMLENKATSSIKNSKYAPKINAYLHAGAEFTSYYSTGNPSEPNRLAVGAGDDFGVTDDSGWNCRPAGDTVHAVEEPLPVGMSDNCVNDTNHNIKNHPDLMSSLNSAGMSWRIYSESQTPGRDWRQSNVSDSSIVAPDNIYTADTPVGAIGNPNLQVSMASSLYATKHNSSLNFQAVRSSAEFKTSNRTLGGGQWDAALKASPKTPADWNVDQFSDDLLSGDVGQFNILEPDQCDDMHGVTISGKDSVTGATGTGSDCGGNAIILRGDNYTDYLIKKIEASPLWNNPQKRVAIVMMFDEGSATTGFNSCCGWNPSAGSSVAGKTLGTLTKNADGTVSVENVAHYNQGNKGHGTSIWGLLTNQPGPKGVVDSDAYSHVSFVRTVQDMFGIADPNDDWSYMNRTKYSEKFVLSNIVSLPEYAGSADTHFDAVRAMNHAYVIPADYEQKNGFPAKQVGPDADQRNPWAQK
ncbi:MAG TPA: alkaline phosphatase family protein [Steroidobacteraceae bacterium]|jgi:hypothetical protein